MPPQHEPTTGPVRARTGSDHLRACRIPSLAAAAILAALLPAVAAAQSTTTTTTTIPIPVTTTLDTGTDVTGGGRFRGGFGPGGYDGYWFEIDGPIVLLTETSNGSDLCSADTQMTLRRDGLVIAADDDSGPGQCSRIERRLLDAGEYEIRVSGFLGEAVSSYYLDVEFVETACGNGDVEPLEQCDDGNTAPGDCCAADCTRETDGAPCSNGRACDGADTCLQGACSVHELNPCAGADGDANCAESCSDTSEGCGFPDPDGSACNDGLFCNGPDRCIQGNCFVHAGDPCRGPDGDGRCSESCRESMDNCTGADPNGIVCDDGAFCNGDDTCFGGVCGVHTGNPCTGPDGDGNCSESCSESKDDCTGPDPYGTTCDDGLWCTGADKCSDGTCSVHAGSGCPGPDGDSNCVESCNEAARNCTAIDPNGSLCSDGLFCNGPEQCASGSCAIHLGDPCPGPDGDANCKESCSEGTDNCTAADPNGSACSDGAYCNGLDTCSAGACTGHAGNPCPGPDGDANCAESCNETADACTAADPGGSACSDSLFCNGLDTCSGGACSLHAGSPCPGADGDANCAESCNETSDACTAADSDGAPCNDGVYCNGADKCSGGACTVHAGNPCPGPDGDASCAESCNEAAANCTLADVDGSACTDGLFCNGADTCLAGACTVHAGSPCPGADGDGNCSESCNEVGDVCTAADANGSACNDGVFCNGADTCSGGTCSVHAGNPCPGPDGDAECAESCSEAADACTAADADGSACNDGVYCNGEDQCASGSCTIHPGTPCPGPDGDANCSESCNEAADACNAPDPAASPCNDGTFCNGADTCSAGSCSIHAGNPCTGPDGDGNCSESCSEVADACTGADPNGSDCNDGLLCNGADSCKAGFCTEHEGSPCEGADGDGDCSESCSDSGDGCSGNDPVGSPCDDGIFCNGADTCLAGTCSVHAGDPCSGPDGDGNCAETCDESANACTAADANGSSCDDGLFCNGADSCVSGACTAHAGDPCPGPDGDSSCAESCSETADACNAADPNGSGCTDGLFCNGEDSCASGSCSAHEGDPCDGPDDDADCSETCDETTDSCSGFDPGGAACDDGAFCNGADSCSEGQCSAHEGDPCPGPDGDADCSETCDESDDGCSASDTNATPCDDGLACNGDDACASGSCSVHDGSLCDDGDPCTQDLCAEPDATCSHPAIPLCGETCGDANDDGNLSASDALLVLRAAVGGPECDARACLCDVNANDAIAAGDALLVLRKAVAIAVVLACEC